MSQTNGVANGVSGAQVPNKASEIGWTFVPQYYTCMHQDPSRLHCFYTKKSTLVHADEKEDVQPSFGQQEIHQRLQALNFENTKVYVSTVDSQASADGGIIIQVIGELSNRGGNWRKFSQTFFLAQQPNGYYVLNDIFRYLSDEEDEDESAAAEEAQPVAEQPMHDASHTASQPTQATTTPAAASAVPEAKPAPAIAEAASAPAQVAPAAPATDAGATPVQAPAQQQPPVRKTWANLAATGADKWASAPAPAGGKSAAAPAASVAAAQPTAAAGAGAKYARSTQTGGAAGAVPGAQVFVKSVAPELAANDALKKALEAQFGATKECQVNAAKGFAFVEFTSPEAARKALAAGSLQVGASSVQIEKRRGAGERGGAPRSRGGHRGGRGAHAAA
ncbi:hypothetical protein MBRA1_000491 [Malassezia brasiliensis]|uniref:G3BP-like protein n=1 Tax=Malassezia brasiliensis TaxID=1821822 RepID=A0AAF0DSC0_9BASI|nr:hypothetical protein MBRA1_000491 [Malassezia brasiliensis]